MKNLYGKVALVSVCTALGFALGANKEVKAATFTLTSTNNFYLYDINNDGLADGGNSQNLPLSVGIRRGIRRGESFSEEYRAFYEFNIAHLSLASDTVISRATFKGSINTVERLYHPHYNSWLNVIGYVENGSADSSHFSKEGVSLDSVRLFDSSAGTTFNLNVTTFVNQIVSNRESFAGFGFRTDPFSDDDYYGDNGYSNDNQSYITLGRSASLTIITVDAEPVPEPTTIFGSVIGLCLGGWLKQKKSSQQNKITP